MRLVLAALLAFFSLAGPALAAPKSQPLAITLSGDGATAERLARYAPGRPIAVSVKVTDGAPYASVTLVVNGPSGERRYPLAAAADGTFGGQLVLDSEGTWTANLLTVENGLQTSTAPFDLNVETAPNGYALVAAIAVGAGAFFIAGGLGWIVLMRLGARNRQIASAARSRAA